MERFIKNDDGTVIDNQLGLIWSQTIATDVDFDDAEKAVAELGPEWRMATIDELLTLVDRSRYSPAANTDIFPDTKSDWYWTSTECAWNDSARWVVYFSYGYVNARPQDFQACVRAVRASQ